MKRTTIQTALIRQRGLTLLELMVALGIGLVLLLALATLMTVANRSSMSRSSAELMDETARQVFSRLETDFRQAGYVDPFDNNTTLSETFDLSDATRMARYIRQKDHFTSADKSQLTLMGRLSGGRLQPVKGCSGTLDPATGNCTTIPDTPRHSIQVSYQVVSTAAPAAPANPLAGTARVDREQATSSNALQGCANVNASQDFPIVVNHYFFDSTDMGDTVTAPRDLRCDSAISNYQAFQTSAGGRTQVPIQSGVEEMVFRYLVTPTEDTPTSSQVDYANVVSGRSVTEYLSAEQVEALPLGWASVVGVEVCLVIAVQPVDGRKDITMADVQPNVPTCLRDAGNNADAAFGNDKTRPSNWLDVREYRRYVRTFSLPNTLYLSNAKI